MDKEIKLAIFSCVTVGILVATAFVYAALNPSPILIETFSGRLDSIEYLQGGGFSSVSSTLLHFSDGTTFEQGGYYEYALGYEYRVTYKLNSLGQITVLDVVRI